MATTNKVQLFPNYAGKVVAYTDFTSRFKITRTDNANARAIGKLPKWTIIDRNTDRLARVDTLEECRELIAKARSNERIAG